MNRMNQSIIADVERSSCICGSLTDSTRFGLDAVRASLFF
jgi:hypothetical protein